MIGEKIGRYAIRDKLGKGGMGEVYLAWDEQLFREVAIKVLPQGQLADEDARKRFRREALSLSGLSHRNLQIIHDFLRDGERDYIVLEYIPGETLEEKIRAGPLPEKEIARLGAQLAEGLSAAHEKGVVHRDLKPSNLKVTPEGLLKILDFGLARFREPESRGIETNLALTQTGTVTGTLPYMPPERLTGDGDELDARSDIYSAGAVLYEMATGQRLFPESGAALVDAILHAEVVPPTRFQPRLSAELERIILKSLEKDSRDRYQSAREMLVDLSKLERGGTTVTRTAIRQPRATKRWIWGAAAAVLLAGIGLLALSRMLGPRDGMRIAVLPFENLGPPDDEFFSEGVTDELISQLGRLGHGTLGVIGRTSSTRYRKTNKSARDIGRELRVGYVLDGSVRRASDRVRIQVGLVRTKDEVQLWTDRFEGDLSNALHLQEEVARKVSNAVIPELSQAAGAAPAPHRPKPEAYLAYLRGRHLMALRDEQSLQRAIDYFHDAVAADSGYAQPYSGLADAYGLLVSYGYLAPREGMPRARAAVDRALALDSHLAEAHASLASILAAYDWDWPGAAREFRRALQMNPSYATAHQWYADFLASIGRFEPALAEMQKARELEPLSPVLAVDLGTHYLLRRNFDSAIERFREAIELEPSYSGAYLGLAIAHLQQKQRAEAESDLQKWAEVAGFPESESAALRQAVEREGAPALWRWSLENLRSQAQAGYVSPYRFAQLYAALGEKDQAFDWLDRCFTERAPGIVQIRVDPMLDGLRSDARYTALVRKLALPIEERT